PGDDDLLLVAPGECSCRRRRTRRPDVEFFDQSLRPVEDRLEAQDQPVPGKQRGPLPAQDQVVGDRVVQDQAGAPTIFGNMTDAGKPDGGRGQVADFAVSQKYVPTDGTARAGEGLDELTLPVAFD